MPRLSTTVGLFQRLSGVEPLIRHLVRATPSQPAPKKSPIIEAMIPDLGLMVFDELHSPRDLIALVHASPNMARIYLMKKRVIVMTMIKNSLDVQAVQTAIRIHHSRKVPGKPFKKLGAIGAELIPDPRALGLDAVAPAAFIALVAPRLTSASAWQAAFIGAVLAAVTIPLVAPGLPVIVAAVGVLAFALWRVRRTPPARAVS